MTDAEYKAQKKRVEMVAEKWRRVLGLGWWRITYAWVRDGGLNDDRQSDGAGDCAADTRAKWQYQEAHIRFCLPVIADIPDDRIEYVVLHEFMHIFLQETRCTNERRDDEIEHEEHAATSLANAFLWTWDAAAKAARKKAA